MTALRRYKSMAPDNEFQFVCPIFNLEVKMRQCVQLRDLKYAGRAPSVRQGCQAVMTACKCPAAEIVRKIAFGNGEVPDDYGSDQPVVGKLRLDVLEKLAPVIVQESTLNAYSLSSTERMLIATSSERIRKAAGMAAMPSDGRMARVSEPTERRKSKPRAAPAAAPKAKPTSSINHAAATGDLAAAIS